MIAKKGNVSGECFEESNKVVVKEITFQNEIWQREKRKKILERDRKKIENGGVEIYAIFIWVFFFFFITFVDEF